MRVIIEVLLHDREQKVSMPQGARPLWIGIARGVPSVSVLMNTDAELVEKTLRTIASDEPFDETSFKSDYIGSYEYENRMYHVVMVA